MKVLLTGAFGNIGTSTMTEILAQGEHSIRCFDLKTEVTEKVARNWAADVEIIWGDITDKDAVEKAVDDVDWILHLAAIIPPLSETNPDLSHAVNVEGMKNLLAAAKSSHKQPAIVFCSSIATYGVRYDEQPPRRADEAPKPEDNYGRQKVECEQLLQNSGLNYVILRLAAVPPLALDTFDPIAFDIHPDTRIEFVHTKDVGLALANTIDNKAALGEILLIGGGKQDQYIYRDWLAEMLTTTGLGPFPDEAFGPNPFYTDWMDTEKSQRILQYQRYSWEDYQKEIRALMGWRIIFVKLLRPFIRRHFLKKSPYYNNR